MIQNFSQPPYLKMRAEKPERVLHELHVPHVVRQPEHWDAVGHVQVTNHVLAANVVNLVGTSFSFKCIFALY